MSSASANPSTPLAAGASPVLAYRVADELPAAFARFVTYARSYRNHSATTMRWHREVFAMFVDFLGTVAVTTVEPHTAAALVQEWIARAHERRLSPFTVQTYWRGLRSFFAFLERADGFPNPYHQLAPPAIPDALPKALTEAECLRVLDAAHNTDWRDAFARARAVAMIGMALYAGLRRSEILHLAFTDVNLDDGSIRVVRGKGRGGGKDRVTYAAPELQALLRTYLDERRRTKRSSVELFTAMRGGHGVSEVTLKRIVERVRATAGVRFSLHRLRHSFVTMLLRRNVPIHVVRDLAGHRDIKTTERYSRVFDEDKRRHVASLTFAPQPTPPPEPTPR
ncbi:MAG: tyrosine-type recombinase/integrase [Thermoanaerobaculia bacterium]